MKSYVFFTTQTSATASMWRIFTTIVGDKLQHEHFVHKYYLVDNLEALKTADIPDKNYLIQFNNPVFFNKDLDLNRYKFIINYRDPRDRLCNKFHWNLIHPKTPDESKESIQNRASHLLESGIDKWVLQQLDIGYHENIFHVLDTCSVELRLVLSYARLCFNFDSFIAKACDFFGVELSEELLSRLEVERTENLASNAQWIGNQWKGSDVLPGRYLRELQPETISQLNQRFEPILRKMAQYDTDYAALYLKGI